MTGAAEIRRFRVVASVACTACAVAGSMTSAQPASATATATQRARIAALIRSAIADHGIRAVIVQATVAGRPVITRAFGQSMPGVPATTKMHFRNGAVAISYMSTLLLRLVQQGEVKLSDRISRWLPNMPDANRVTLGMLARMTAGYHDYVLDRRFQRTLFESPFRALSTKQQLRFAFDEPLQFRPGTNFSYSHSDYVILGLALEKITGEPLNVALRKLVLRPLGLRNTVASQTAAIPAPVLHAYSSERREFLGIAPSTPFIEDSTFWNPSWTLARGAVQTTDIADMTRTAIGIGSGRLLSPRLHRLQIAPHIGFGHPQPGCERCATLTRGNGYGLGIVRNRGWVLQNALFAGYAANESYLPSRRVSIALAMTFKPGGFDAQGDPTPYWRTLWEKIATVLAPRARPIPR